MIRALRGTRRFAAIATLAAGALLLAGCTSAPAPDARATDLPAQAAGGFSKDITAKLNAALEDAMKLSGSSGAIAGVWAPWAGSWVVAPGTTTQDGSTPMARDMRFRIGGNTQAMTCSVLLQLADNGTVRLDDPVTKYLKRMPGIDGITLGQLCRETAGLGDYSPALPVQFVNNPTRPWVPLELVSDALVSKHPSAPGKEYHPSGAGYVLLGMALEAAAHASWKDLYQRYVFDRVGLQRTTFPSAGSTEIGGDHPHGYATELDRKTAHPVCGTTLDETELSTSMANVSGGVVSDLTDLKDFVRALGAGTLVSDASKAQQFKTVPLGGDAEDWLGYGLGVMTYGPLLGHEGSIPGFLSVMLTNSTNGPEFIRMLGLQLAAIAAGAPAKAGTAPSISLPWTVKDASDALAALDVCKPDNAKKTEKPKAGASK